MTIQLGWLRTFVTVYRLGSFTKAAQALRLSQPAVTHQVRNLEKELGRLLFERLPRGVQPTPAADALIREVQGPIDSLAGAVERSFGDRQAGRPVHLGGPVELMTSRVIPAVSDLVAEGLKLRMSFGHANDLLAILLDRRVDLVLSTVRPRVRGIAATPLVDEEYVLLASEELSRSIPRDRLAEDGPAVLEKYPLISYAEVLPIIRRYWIAVFGTRPTVEPTLVVPDLRGALAAVKSSAGISVLPTYLCVEELAAGEVVPLLEPEVPPINTFYLLVRQGELSRPNLALLHGHLLAKAQLWT
ncbi:LysR family transcriptional regulator [Streptomyces poonensis]|uniref:LysR family transcriptional regulator n=1 Tax=Streptomyces poonensis TaxID=68255 RepID=A0A918PGK3_9ACTN|nr:LysR family transcriptional regulator [Streptomyces poonensis]GGZ04686.1 LysR family transcriptional regulator [Streptomyces poonensis]GLJ89410.1 LysR family transcriptional regulator [Streptomyces poonensis]